MSDSFSYKCFLYKCSTKPQDSGDLPPSDIFPLTELRGPSASDRNVSCLKFT